MLILLAIGSVPSLIAKFDSTTATSWNHLHLFPHLQYNSFFFSPCFSSNISSPSYFCSRSLVGIWGLKLFNFFRLLFFLGLPPNRHCLLLFHQLLPLILRSVLAILSVFRCSLRLSSFFRLSLFRFIPLVSKFWLTSLCFFSWWSRFGPIQISTQTRSLQRCLKKLHNSSYWSW